MHQTSGNWRLGLALSLLTVFLWGILPIALSVTLRVLDTYTLVWFRFLAAFGLLAIYLQTQGKLPTRKQLLATSWQLLLIATVFLAANYILFLQGLALTSPANAQVLIQLAPILMGFGGLIIFRERYNLVQWGGIAVLTSGFGLFFHEKLSQSNTISTSLPNNPHNYLLGSGLIVLAAITWAVYALAQKQLLQTLSSANIMLILYGGCTLLFTFFALPQRLFSLDFFHWGMLIFCALNTLIAYGAFAESLEHWEASRVSAVLAITPIVTLFSVWLTSVFLPNLISPDKLTIPGIIGAILVVFGSMLIALGKR
ncbi:DMT family transporter [Calothrix sp. 336/3]|uniref:DMT family transporter n=1 Tax=Calothrix sp. 336/3 TaxID=1337936 RepID=UPI0004E377F9|nr:DMT family transporter [Calothrix sp. 336/3]AKG23415.1 membrane protein [Calothrix sp. 336/3]